MVLKMLTLIILISTSQLMVYGIKDNPLNGKHLHAFAFPLIATFEMRPNEQGELKPYGVLPDMMEYLTRRFNFSYSYSVYSGEGGFPFDQCYYKKRNCSGFSEADVYLAAFVGVWDRYNLMDFPASFVQGPLAAIIPIPKSTNNMNAIIEPLKKEVWGLLIASFGAFFIALHLLDRFSSRLTLIKSKKSNTNKNYENSFVNSVDFLLRIFFSQGVFCTDRGLAVSMIVASWGLFAFVIVSSYNNTLISFVTSPNLQPIINSIYDVPNVPGLKVTTVRGRGFDLIVSSAKSGVFKKINDMMDADPSLRCNTPAGCLKKVNEGGHVHVDSEGNLRLEVIIDVAKTRTCHFIFAKETFLNTNFFTGLKKGSPYIETFSKGILELADCGIMNHWRMTKLVPQEPPQCLAYKEIPVNPRLSLRNMSGAFVVFGVGTSLSVICFICEIIVHKSRNRN